MTSTAGFGRFSISSASRPFLRAPGKLATPAFPASARLRAARAPRPEPHNPRPAPRTWPHLVPPPKRGHLSDKNFLKKGPVSERAKVKAAGGGPRP